MRTARITALLLGTLGWPALAGAELVLVDERVLLGESVERKRDLYLLQIAGDGVVTIPVALVRGVRLVGAPAEPARQPVPRPEVSGEPSEPSTSPPVEARRRVAESPLDDPLPRDRTAPSRFPRTPVDTGWRPAESLLDDPLPGDRSNPARFPRAPVETRWRPEERWLLEVTPGNPFRPSRWPRGPLDPRWQPSDGFSRGDDS